MKKIALKMLLLAVLALLPIGMQAQRMTQKLAKKAGVVVLYDNTVNKAGTQGTVIYLRMKDKTRDGDWKKSVNVMEVDLRTKTKAGTYLPVAKDHYNGLGLLYTGNEGPHMTLYKNKEGYLEFSISDKYGYRTYRIAKAVFFKDFVDALYPTRKNTLGTETDPALAFQYISKMFSVYE